MEIGWPFCWLYRMFVPTAVDMYVCELCVYSAYGVVIGARVARVTVLDGLPDAISVTTTCNPGMAWLRPMLVT